jgi:DNA-binding transcriptional LysR family regulator
LKSTCHSPEVLRLGLKRITISETLTLRRDQAGAARTSIFECRPLKYFADRNLLLRTAKGYEPTPQGERLLKELEVMLPRLDRLIAGSGFDPATEHTSFRIAATDNATSNIAPVLCREVMPTAKQVRFTFVAWRDDVFDDLSHGSLDLALIGDEGHVPTQLQTEVIYEEEFVCVVSAQARYSRQITLKQYLSAEHIGISVAEGSQNIPEKRLAADGHRRRSVITVPYFGAALRCVVGTELIATVPRRFAAEEAHNPAIKILKPPPQMTGFKYLMIWHPRVTTDAAHSWLRTTVSNAGKSVAY